MMKRNQYVALTLLILLVLPFVGVSPAFTKAQDTEKVIKVGVVGDPENLNPILAWTELAWILIEWMYEPLVRWDLSGGEWKIAPGLAESWEWSEDGTKCTFHLVQNATWHDGTPVTAYDVNWTIFTMTWLAWWRASTGHIDHENIVVIDDYTIELSFVKNGYKEGAMWQAASPFWFWRDWYDNTSVAVSQDYFLTSIPYLPIFPAHIWDPISWHDPVWGMPDGPQWTPGGGTGYGFYDVNDTWVYLGFWDYYNWDGISWGLLDPTWNEPRIGSGPFEFVSWTPGENLVFDAHEDYHWGAPNVDSIEVVIYSTVESMTQAVISGDIDVCETTVSFTELTDFGPDVEVMENPFMGFEALFVNAYEPYCNASAEYEGRGPKHNALLENHVRKAIHQAVDKDRIAEVAYLGTANVTDSPIHKSLPWYNDDITHFTEGTAAAIATLEAAGWERNAADLWEKEVDGVNETLSFGLKYVAGIPTEFALAQLIKEDLEAAGFAITTIPMEATTFNQDITNGVWNFDLMTTFYTELGDPNYFIYYMRATSVVNLNGISIPRIEEIFVEQQEINDFDDRKVLIDEFQQIIYDDSSVIPLVNYLDVEIYRKDRWQFTETDWHSGVVAIPNVKAWRTVDVAPEPTTTPPAPLPIEMVVLGVGIAVVAVVITVGYWVKRK
ncbi:MAG: ABC transporter substrate-binding protein [Candidatus Thorarchaeota archaeon]